MKFVKLFKEIFVSKWWIKLVSLLLAFFVVLVINIW